MKKNNPTSEIIQYIISKLGDLVEGRKKVMKLMFLIEHFDLDKREITTKSYLGNEFQIYYYGVFSQNVMDTMLELINNNTISGSFPIKMIQNVNVILDENVKNRVDSILELFGNHTGYTLEVSTLRMLGIEPHNKVEYFGKPILSIIK